MAADLLSAWNGKDRALHTVLPHSETTKLLTNMEALLPRIEALETLCRRQWFTRLWIYQEYHLSTIAIAFIGRRSFDMRDLHKTVLFIKNGQTGNLRVRWRIPRVVHLVSSLLVPLKPQERPISVIKTLKHSLCADERDRVYAILALIGPEYRAEIVPDYTKSLQEVNKEFFLCMLKIQSPVPMHGGSGRDESGSISWAHIFSHMLPTLCPSFASGQSKHEFLYEESNESLRVPVNAIGTIAAIWFSGPERSYLSLPDRLRLLRAHAQPNMRASAYPLGGNMLDAYICSFAGGEFYEHFAVPWMFSLQELRELVRSETVSKEINAKAATTSFSCITRRAIFSTTDGLIGLCPHWGRSGDKIYVALGVERAILVSNVEDKPNHYQLKGECYVHGLMSAEGLLGSLRSDGLDGPWSFQFEEIQGSYKVVFTNGKTKTQNDPRLGPLPEGWKKRYWSRMHRKYYDHEFEKDGTIRSLFFEDLSNQKITKSDPRMTSVALKERGVVLEDIIIV
jgi:hypothetical protein